MITIMNFYSINLNLKHSKQTMISKLCLKNDFLIDIYIILFFKRMNKRFYMKILNC